jgi:hypothetical protein
LFFTLYAALVLILGLFLGTAFKVFILAPASGFVLIISILGCALLGYDLETSALLVIASLAVVQIGYVIGAFAPTWAKQFRLKDARQEQGPKASYATWIEKFRRDFLSGH